MGGSLTPEEISEIRKSDRYNKIKYFVESGTYKGDTTSLVSPLFDQVYTIEIHEGLYKEAISRFKQENLENITCLLGNSLDLLGEVSSKVSDGAVFFLDAHISGSDSSWDGVHRVPIYEELDAILQHRLGPSVFVIDDLRLWVQGTWDWSHVTNEGIIKKFLDKEYHVLSYYEKNDRFYVYI